MYNASVVNYCIIPPPSLLIHEHGDQINECRCLITKLKIPKQSLGSGTLYKPSFPLVMPPTSLPMHEYGNQIPQTQNSGLGLLILSVRA